jgi:dTDP-4-dehydrorhamnose reductase
LILRKKILFTGGSGLLALNWANQVCNDFDVVLGLHEREINIKGAKSAKIIIESENEFVKNVENIKPDLVVHTAGMTNVDQCEAFPELANKVNFEVAKIVSDVCQKNNIDLIFISTDHLFDGSVPNVSENHVKNPLNCYGRTKSLGEDYIHFNNPNALIIRTNFFGWGPSYRQSFSDFVIDNLRKGTGITLFNDVFYTPILINTLVDTVMALYLKNANGIFNVVGNDRVSKLEFGLELAKVFGLNLDLIKEGSINGNKQLVKRPKDLSLSNSKANRFLKKEIVNLSDQIARLHDSERNKISILASNNF